VMQRTVIVARHGPNNIQAPIGEGLR
jgi:hypothetical protein